MPYDSPSHERFSNRWSSRRQFLQAAGTASVIALAGCQGDTSDGSNNDNSDSTSSGSSSGDQPADSELTLDSLGIPASDVQWNDFNFSNYVWMIQSNVMDPFAVYDPVNDTFVGLLAKDWTIDTDKQILRIKLNENYHWHDGKQVVGPVTAQDVYTHFQMEQYMGFSSSEYTTGVNVVDKFTAEFDLKKGYKNKNFITFNLLLTPLSHGFPPYQEWVQRFKNASSQSEKDKIATELGELTISSKDMLSYGPFAVQSASQQEFTAIKNPGHPAADKINFPKIIFKYVGSEQKIWQSLSNGQLDVVMRMNIPQDVRSNFPDHVENTTYSSLGGMSLAFKWNDEVVGDPRVRRAIGYIIDQQAVAQNAGAETHRPVTHNTGLATDYTSKYLKSDKYIDYSKNYEKATNLLEDAGFTKKGDQWMTADGSKFGPDIKTGTTGGPGLLALQTITSQLTQFGIDTRLRTQEATSFTENVWNQGNFRIAASTWGADYPQPYAWYNSAFVEDRDKMEMPNEISIPAIGKLNGPENTINLNLDTAVNNLTKLSGQKLTQQVRELAWLWNSMIPEFQIYEERIQTWFTNDDWNYPPLDSDIMQRRIYTPFQYVLKAGKFTAKTK